MIEDKQPLFFANTTFNLNFKNLTKISKNQKMISTALRTLKSTVNRTTTNQSHTKMIRNIRSLKNRQFLRREFFGFFGKNNNKKEAPSDDQSSLYDSEAEFDLSKYENLGPTIENIKKENAIVETKLPPQNPEDIGKLTVCLEIDDIFLNTFYPDGDEGYLGQPKSDYDFIIDMNEYNTSVNIYMRPNFEELFEYLKNETEAIIYSRAQQTYVDAILDRLDPDREVFKYRIYQDSCNLVDIVDEEIYEYIKDVSILGRDIKKVVSVDCDILSGWLNPNNQMLVKNFRPDRVKDDEDDTLRELIQTLEYLKSQDDVRFQLSKIYGLEESLRDSKLL